MNITIIRTDGTQQIYAVAASKASQEIGKLIGAKCTDTVNLRDGRVMIVDDNGYETQCVEHGNGHFELRPVKALKPVNAKATEMYWAICVPGTTHQIVGDVAICNDADFA